MDYEITPEEVKTKLDQGEKFTLLDVREPWEFETVHMAGAKLVPMGDIPSRALGTKSGRSHRGGLPSRRALDECDRVAAAAGVRESSIDAWRD
jgi:rhodanese-related sulfurtransferase